MLAVAEAMLRLPSANHAAGLQVPQVPQAAAGPAPCLGCGDGQGQHWGEMGSAFCGRSFDSCCLNGHHFVERTSFRGSHEV